MEGKKLYPLSFAPELRQQSWGKEIYHIADLGFIDSKVSGGWLGGDSLSDIMETYLDRMVGENVFYSYGRQFPVCVRTLEIDGRTPLWVCPDDMVSVTRFDALGKAKLYRVLSAQEGAVLYLGLKEDVSAEAFYASCRDGSLFSFVREIHVKAGDWFYIAPGTIHGAAGRMTILEISESSPMEMVLCNPDGSPVPDDVPGVVEAIDFVDLRAYTAVDDDGGCDCHDHEHCHHHHHHHHHHHEEGHGHDQDGISENLVDCEEFTVTRLSLSDPLHIYTGQFGSFIIYSCIAGEASIQIPGESGTEYYILKEGGNILIPAETSDFLLVPRSGHPELLETAVRTVERQDPYIDEDAEPFIEGEEEDEEDE